MGQEQSTLDAGAAEIAEPQRGAAQPRVAGSVPHVLRWPHGGKTAYICGSFTHWQKVPMHWQQVGAAGVIPDRLWHHTALRAFEPVA